MPRDKSHLLLHVEQVAPTLFKGRGYGNNIIPNVQNRVEHSRRLASEISEIDRAHPNKSLYTIKFNGNAETGLFFEKLDQKTFGMELLSIQEKDGKVISANVLVDSKKAFNRLNKVFQRYGEALPTQNTLPYVGSIASISTANSVADLFTDAPEQLPNDENDYWWELWLLNNNDGDEEKLRHAASQHGIFVKEKFINFPDRLIFICKASVTKLNTFIQAFPDMITEIHLAKTLSPFIPALTYQEQEAIVDDILQKTTYPDENTTIRITILDNGLIVRHPLLDPVIVRNLKAIDSFIDDKKNDHTTCMGSVVTFGDITHTLSLPSIKIPYKIESIQIVNSTATDPELWGAITEIAVNKTRDYPNINNAYVMAVSAENISKDFGQPTSWSANIDKLAFEQKTLFAISVGNIVDIISADKYEKTQQSACVEDPAQSWNALSIGAYTELADQNRGLDNNFLPLASAGDLSPYSKTSVLFSKQWPIKPEVVFEGGNRVIAEDNHVCNGDGMFDLVACSHKINNPSFCGFNMTSAATGMAGQFIGNLIAKYPKYWPETIRALVVNSADWTPEMLDKRINVAIAQNKDELTKVIRMCGYGVPNLAKAQYSASNALSLIAEKEFQVYDYKKDKNGTVPRLKRTNALKNEKVCQILMFPLPWPEDLLRSPALRDKQIKLKITLSYFIQPNPGSRGYKNKFSYQSHSLRFDLQMPTETENEFMKRINANIGTEENEQKAPGQPDNRDWLFGKKSQMRTTGSLHQDILTTTGAELATMKNIAIYSIGGWWRDSRKIRPEDTKTRFSLVISLDAGEADVDIYTEIENIINIENAIAIQL